MGGRGNHSATCSCVLVSFHGSTRQCRLQVLCKFAICLIAVHEGTQRGCGVLSRAAHALVSCGKWGIKQGPASSLSATAVSSHRAAHSPLPGAFPPPRCVLVIRCRALQGDRANSSANLGRGTAARSSLRCRHPMPKLPLQFVQDERDLRRESCSLAPVEDVHLACVAAKGDSLDAHSSPSSCRSFSHRAADP